MRTHFEPRLDVLPAAQRELWPLLAPTPKLSLVLYGGTAVALQLGHRQSFDFDFFAAAPLDKAKLRAALDFLASATIIQDEPDTLVALIAMPSGAVRVSLFGNIKFGHVHEPLQTADRVLLVASLTDLMATKLKAILDRAEAKDYRDIAAMLAAGVALAQGLAAFSRMFGQDAGLPLRALGYFADGDLPALPEADKALLRRHRDAVTELPDITLHPGLSAPPS